MVQLKTVVNNALRASFSKMIDGETREWPPKCFAFTYQPQRPKRTSPLDKISDTVKSKRHERR